jgi:hypothetical protein
MMAFQGHVLRDDLHSAISECCSAVARIVLAEKDLREEKVMETLEAIEEVISAGQKRWNRSKIMLVGEGRDGNSSLANAIIGNSFDPTAPSTSGVEKFQLQVNKGSINQSHTGWCPCENDGCELESAVVALTLKIIVQKAKLPATRTCHQDGQ